MIWRGRGKRERGCVGWPVLAPTAKRPEEGNVRFHVEKPKTLVCVYVFTHVVYVRVLVSEVPAWARRNNTSVTSRGAVRCTVRRLTCELTSAGTRERDPSFARGVIAERDSPAATSSSVIAEHTQVRTYFQFYDDICERFVASRGHGFGFVFQERRSLCVRSAPNVSCAVIIWPNTLKLTRTKKG